MRSHAVQDHGLDHLHDLQPDRQRGEQPAVTLFAAGMIGLGILGLAVGDFALQWQPVAPWFPGRTFLAYAAAVLMVVCGAGLLFRRIAAWAATVLFAYGAVWMLLKVPSLVVAPGMEAVWLGAGEIGVLLAGAWTLFARLSPQPHSRAATLLAGPRGVRAARVLFGISLLPIGLSHLIYVQPTHDLVPAWLPFRTGWAYLTGVGQMACGLGVLARVLPRIAAWAEAAQISIFTLLIWIPAAIAHPHLRLNWTALCISWAIAAAAWVVAQNVEAQERGGKRQTNEGAGNVLELKANR